MTIFIIIILVIYTAAQYADWRPPEYIAARLSVSVRRSYPLAFLLGRVTTSASIKIAEARPGLRPTWAIFTLRRTCKLASPYAIPSVSYPRRSPPRRPFYSLATSSAVFRRHNIAILIHNRYALPE